jgi:GNAT superfamily N-acetyltransferase
MPPAIILARAASRDDRGGAVLTLARAFARDPFIDWLVRRDARRAAALRACFDLAFADVALPTGCVEVTDDLSGVALWMPPGTARVGLSDLTLLPALARVVGARRLLGRLAGLHALQRQHPREPHYYLLALGVDPERQGQGSARRCFAAGSIAATRSARPRTSRRRRTTTGGSTSAGGFACGASYGWRVMRRRSH